MNKIISDLNNIYKQTINYKFNDKLDILLNYFINIKNYNIKKLLKHLNNYNKILFNNENYNIFEIILDLIQYNITNYNIYEIMMKDIMNDILLLNNIKTFNEYLINANPKNIKINNIELFRHQYYYITNNKYKVIPLNDIILYNEKNIEDIKKDYIEKTRKYKLVHLKGYNNKFIILSYFCYFKSAVNMIINHPYFLKLTNIDTDSLKIMKGGYYHPNELLLYGGNELWNLLSNDDLDIIKIIELFQTITNEQYLIGLPGIKYYPHIILQYLLYFLNNNFSQIFKIYSFMDNYYYIISLSDNIFLDTYDKEYINKILDNRFCINYLNDYINDYIINKTKNKSLLFACTINDPLCYNSFNILKNKRTKISDINIKSSNNLKFIKKYNLKYQYDFFINNYYLQSFILIEYKEGGLSFHCVYFKIEYDDKYNITNIIRYDGSKQRFFNNINNELYYNKNNKSFMINEMNVFLNNNYITQNYDLLNDETSNVKIVLNQPYINDYFDNINYYKICLVCYVEKT